MFDGSLMIVGFTKLYGRFRSTTVKTELDENPQILSNAGKGPETSITPSQIRYGWNNCNRV